MGAGEIPIEVQRQAVARLKANSTVQSVAEGRVFNYVPDKSPYPYLVLDELEAIEFDTDTKNGMVIDVVVRIYDQSTHRGDKNIRALMAAVYEEFHHKEFDLSSIACRNSVLNFVRNSITPEPDVISTQGMCVYAATCMEE